MNFAKFLRTPFFKEHLTTAFEWKYSFFEKALRRREIKQDYPKQSTRLELTTKKYYVNGAIE